MKDKSKDSQLSCAYQEDGTVADQLLGLIMQETVRQGGGSFSFVEGMLKGLFVKIAEVARPSGSGRFGARGHTDYFQIDHNSNG